jgi:hypothetical protein
MNFKFTLLKSIVSLIAIVVADFIQVKSIFPDCITSSGASCPQVFWKEFALEPRIIITSLIVGLIVYIVWSLIQKKK